MRPHVALLTSLLFTFAGCAGRVASPPSSRPRPPTPAATTPPPGSTPTAAEPPAPTVDARTARLARLIKLWGEVRFNHPAFVLRNVDWDAPFVTALPKVEAAATDEQEAAALDEMLRALGDPGTRVVRRPSAVPTGGKPEVKMLAGGTLVVRLSPADWQATSALLSELGEALPKAKAVVVDVRPLPYDPGNSPTWRLFGWLAPRLIERELVEPVERAVQRHGYPSDDRRSGLYGTRFVSDVPSVIMPEKPAGGGPPPRLAVIVGRGSELPQHALLLQRGAGAVIVAEGKLSDAVVPVSNLVPFSIGPEHVALVRTVDLPALEPARADAEVPASPDGPDAALAAALRLLKGKAAHRPPATVRGGAEEGPRQRFDARYESTPYPDRGHRLLALARLWNVLDLFFPYKHLLPPGAWDRALIEALPAFEAARDEREYVLAVAALGARTGDSHVDLFGGPAERMFDRQAKLPIEVQRVEGRPVVTRVYEEARASGVSVGDVVEATDGEPFEARVARLAPYVAASTPWHHAYRVDALALGGALGSTVTLTVRDAAGRPKEVRLPRERKSWSNASPVYRELDDGVGYVDLTRLEFSEADAMFAALGSTKAIVFDVRGLPRMVVAELAARLNRRHAPYTGLFLRPVVGSTWHAFEQNRQAYWVRIPTTGKPPYGGRVVLLADERTFSLGEYDVQILQATAGATLVGSSTAGVNGDMTNVCLPGGVCVRFTGQEARLPDGGQLQRVGLRPDVAVRPTIAGLRAGRDEVLERALQWLRDGR